MTPLQRTAHHLRYATPIVLGLLTWVVMFAAATGFTRTIPAACLGLALGVIVGVVYWPGPWLPQKRQAASRTRSS